jgi:CarboxypepD_reg-like domain
MLLHVCWCIWRLSFTSSSDTVAGQVIDAARHRIAGVTVSLVELHRTTATDSSGRFHFTDVGSGRFTLVASRIG